MSPNLNIHVDLTICVYIIRQTYFVVVNMFFRRHKFIHSCFRHMVAVRWWVTGYQNTPHPLYNWWSCIPQRIARHINCKKWTTIVICGPYHKNPLYQIRVGYSTSEGPFHWHMLNEIEAWISITFISDGMQLLIQAPTSTASEIRTWMNNYFPLFYLGVITYTCLNPRSV